jgi:hypothetical protein
MINLMTTFGIPFRLSRSQAPRNLEEWTSSSSPVIALTRELWDIWRFFGVNQAEKFSSFSIGGVLEMTQPGSIVNGYARDGRVLIVTGVQGGRTTRGETVMIREPARLGIQSNVRYDVVDLRNRRYLANSLTAEDLRSLPVELIADEPLILLIAPERKGPRLVWFRGADEVFESAAREFRVNGVPGSPLKLYVNGAGRRILPVTHGFKHSREGGFEVFSGEVPEDRIVRLTESP